MTVAGKLTYEDVANVDAIGVVTGRAGFHERKWTRINRCK